MADKITDANLIKTTQIQQKQSADSMIALRPETQADIVINTSTNISGATVDEAFDNALPVVGTGAVEVNLKNNQLENKRRAVISPSTVELYCKHLSMY